VVAALCARGTTVLENVFHLDRGYEDLVAKLEGLGARVTRTESHAGDVRPDLSKVVGD